MESASIHSQSLPQPATMLETRERTILIADDEPAIRQILRVWLEQERYRVIEARSGEETIALLTRQDAPHIDLILLDYELLDMRATDVQQAMQVHEVKIPVVVITAKGRAQSVIATAAKGAIQYLRKPFTDGTAVLEVVRDGLDQWQRRHTSEIAVLPEVVPGESFIGEDPAMIASLMKIGGMAHSDATVMITGPAGSGKTLLAETIHASSDRRRADLHKFNVTEVPVTLMESKLFGTVKGAYNGAPDQPGIFEIANKGSVFLDEIGELSLEAQTNLLGILAEKQTVTRLGSQKPIEVDVRVIVATNRDLAREVREGHFRQDLYDRLNAVSITMPPLRDHMADIPGLVAHFLDMHRFMPKMPPARITVDALKKLQEYSWPGNVRELEQCIKRAVDASRGDVILPENITFLHEKIQPQLDIASMVRKDLPLREMVRETITMAARTALDVAGGDPKRAAKALGISRRAFEALRDKFDM
jgi:DNA-binding NtrC family response regulator